MTSPRPALRELVERGVAAAVGALPAPAQRAIGGRPTVIDGQHLHPEVQSMLKLMSLAKENPLSAGSVIEARRGLRRTAAVIGGAALEVAQVRELSVPGPGGPIRTRVYLPAGLPSQAGALVFYHGGGWVVGDLETHDNLCRYLAVHAGVAVLSADYRLAPEHKFPAATEDALAVYRYAVANADSLGLHPDQIAVGGDSAGGNLAAVTAQQAKAAGDPVPAFQLLIYPAVDFSVRRESRRLFGTGFVLTSEKMDWYQDQYLRSAEDQLDPRASPLLAEDLSGLPPAYLVTAGFDPLRDEGEEYADKLSKAGVPVFLRRHHGLIHGFANVLGIGHTGRDAALEAAAALRMGLAFAAAKG
ncbi:alpha/beta hydrolase [Crossiella sp. CA-258035]|uniref:alpha/beta hydrolase n=1 Tax=Crossiella sp. CA-258035 TaxID=2981138 RepID=UPI0024BC6710|nr:alpha/beta hydrolase [Crossiella sp. CA-258035]WHT21062.1 alpha/beta hydrolase [Crossiella sp. CA-258035]